MNNAQVFFKTKVQNTNVFSGIGNFFLAPVRYAFNGKSVSIRGITSAVTHERSFGKCDNSGCSFLYSAAKNFGRMIRAAVMITMFVPGILLGSIFKGLSYISRSVRDQHTRVKLHFTPRDITIGSETTPFSLGEIRNLLQEIRNDPLHQKINALIIYGNNASFNTGHLSFDSIEPKKLVFVNGEIVSDVPADDCQLNIFLNTPKKWLQTSTSPDEQVITQILKKTVGEALAHRPECRPGTSKPYRTAYIVKPQPTASSSS